MRICHTPIPPHPETFFSYTLLDLSRNTHGHSWKRRKCQQHCYWSRLSFWRPISQHQIYSHHFSPTRLWLPQVFFPANFFFLTPLSREKIDTLTLQFFDRQVFSSYLAMEEIIGDLRKRSTPPVVSWKTFRNYLSWCGITQESQIVKASQSLLNMGNILYFQSSHIRNLVILNPQWLYEAIATVMNAK